MTVTAPVDLGQLLRVTDRSSFLYLERTSVHREGNAITATDVTGATYIPGAGLAALLLGPGTTITHHAISLLADCGVSVVWVGENGVRYYAHGRSLASSSALLIRQAHVVSNQRLRLTAAKRLHSKRYPDADVNQMSMKQMLGQEGSRVKAAYREHAARTGVTWSGRNYDRNSWDSSDIVNTALSAANAALYGAVHAAIVAIGCAPGLGIIHTGNDKSLVYDIADQYKAETSIPVAFDIARAGAHEPARAARQEVRDRIFAGRILDRAVADIKHALNVDDSDDNDLAAGLSAIWDGENTVASGTNHGGDS